MTDGQWIAEGSTPVCIGDRPYTGNWRRRQTQTGNDVTDDHVTTGAFSRPSSGDVFVDVVESVFVVRRVQTASDRRPAPTTTDYRPHHL